MKKLLLCVILSLCYTTTISSMILGGGQLVRCPNCSEDKELMSIVSGNTFGALNWSDGYQYAPMLPRISPVQKCPHCNSYFILQEENPRYIKDEDSNSSKNFDTGILSFSEMKEALLKLENSELESEDEIALRMEFLHRFNDAFRVLEPIDFIREKEGNLERNENDWELHKDNILKLITLLQNELDLEDFETIPLVSELYREIGKYKECLTLLENYQSDSPLLSYYSNEIKERALSQDRLVFLLDTSELKNNQIDDDENTITIEIDQIEFKE